MKLTALLLLFAALAVAVEGQGRWPWIGPPPPPPTFGQGRRPWIRPPPPPPTFRPILPTAPSLPPLSTAAPALDGSGALIGCNCPATPEFNPVCGSDGLTYGSPQKLNCARGCGHEVTLAFYGTCAAG